MKREQRVVYLLMIGMTENQLRLIERFGVSIQNHVVVGECEIKKTPAITSGGVGERREFFYPGCFFLILTDLSISLRRYRLSIPKVMNMMSSGSASLYWLMVMVIW